MLIDWTAWWHHRILGQACVISLQFVSLSLFLLLLKLCSKALDPGSCKHKITMPIFVKLPIHGHCCYFTKIFRIRNCSRLNCEQWRNRLVSRPVVLSVRLHGILCEVYNTVGRPKCLLNFLLSGMIWWTLTTCEAAAAIPTLSFRIWMLCGNLGLKIVSFWFKWYFCQINITRWPPCESTFSFGFEGD